MVLKNKLKGKVITLVGSPATGKTFLGNILKEELGAHMLYEQPADGFPDKIKHNLESQTNLLETILYFRNVQIENHLIALDLASYGKIVVVDTPFYQNQLFIDLYIEDVFTKQVLFKLGENDLKAYPKPDITIYIKTTIPLVMEYLRKRHGEREWEKDSWFNFISKMPPLVDAHMNKIKSNLSNYIVLDRALFDFTLEKDKQKLFTVLSKIEK